MIRITTTLAILAALATPAMAQSWHTTPNIPGDPTWGSTTTGPGGTWHTMPNIPGDPTWGYTSTGPNGHRCSTTMNIPGDPTWGTTTTCN